MKWRQTQMSKPNLSSLFPGIDVLLELEPAELGAGILELWESTAGRNENATITSFIEPCFGVQSMSGWDKRKERPFVLALAEAWNWLENFGLIMEDPDQPPDTWYRRTRRGRELQTRTDVEAYAQAAILSRNLLHPIIDQKAYPAFRRGEYDVAVFQAFKAIEVAVREAAGFEDDLIGVPLMNKAFHLEDGPLTDLEAVRAEREAVRSLFAGAIGHAKNPQSHRETPVSMNEAAQLLAFAGYLMGHVEYRRLLT